VNWRGLAARSALVCTALAVAIALAEGGLRAFAALGGPAGAQLKAYDPLAVLIEPHGELGYRQRPDAVYRYINGASATSNHAGYRGPVVAHHKPAGTIRIVLLGGSSTHGWGVADSQTIDVYLRADLASRYPDRRFEVVNLAFDGYDAWQMFERLRSDGLPLSPDLVIANEGINDVRNARYANLREHDPRALLWQTDLARLREERRRGGPALWTRLKHRLLLARLPGFVRHRTRRGAEVRHGNRQSPHPEAADLFERHLERIADLLAPRGIPLLFSTPPSSLRTKYRATTPPPRDYWIVDAATTQTYRDTLAARMRAVAARRRARGDRVGYVAPRVVDARFLDDAHLDPGGNRAVAEHWASAAAALLGLPARPR